MKGKILILASAAVLATAASAVASTTTPFSMYTAPGVTEWLDGSTWMPTVETYGHIGQEVPGSTTGKWAQIPGARWVWSHQYAIGSARETVLFRQTIVFPDVVPCSLSAVANVRILADNGFEFTVNGHIVVPDPDEFNYTNPEFFVIPPAYLQPGVNVITARVTNYLSPPAIQDQFNNPAGLDFAITGTYTVDYLADNLEIQPPLREGGSYNGGRTLPVKFQLGGHCADDADAQSIVPQLVYRKGSSGPFLPAVGDGSTNDFRRTGPWWHYNWDTKGLSAGAYELKIDYGNNGFKLFHITIT